MTQNNVHELTTKPYTVQVVAVLDQQEYFSSYRLVDKSVHISNAYAREEFRNFSYLSEKAISVILACGTKVYDLALEFLNSKNN